MAERHHCPSCGGDNLDWTQPDGRGTSWTVRFTSASMPQCVRCTDPKHPARGLPIRPRLASDRAVPTRHAR